MKLVLPVRRSPFEYIRLIKTSVQTDIEGKVFHCIWELIDIPTAGSQDDASIGFQVWFVVIN